MVLYAYTKQAQHSSQVDTTEKILNFTKQYRAKIRSASFCQHLKSLNNTSTLSLNNTSTSKVLFNTSTLKVLFYTVICFIVWYTFSITFHIYTHLCITLNNYFRIHCKFIFINCGMT
ncbi:hypothetical protein EB796_010275 [Bugula neritina]|uniref:Uncharacterized protein n=1 Tax=Bugula neritina TaxID=10212 RepID=A0A7J7JYC2_BUGNE|nr:hypothetical protein EB796_010275 [Bugula neritina]